MKKYSFYIISLWFSLSCFSQTSKGNSNQAEIESIEICGGMDSIINKIGKWKKHPDNTLFADKNFPRNQYNQVFTRQKKLYSLFAEIFTDLGGIEPNWYSSMRGSSSITGGPVPNTFSSFYLTYYCNTNYKKVMLGDETRNWIYVYINHWGWFAEKLTDWDINNDGKMIHVYVLPPKAGEWKGRTLYAPTNLPSSLAVVIGHNGKLPWHSLTQKQYLSGLRNMLTAKKEKDLQGFDSIEVSLNKNIEIKIPHITAEQQEKINQQRRNDLKKFQDNKENQKAIVIKSYNESVKYIDEYLAGTTAEMLEKPAIIDPKYNAYGFKGVFGDEKNGGIRLIAFSTKYYNKELPSYVPQFMILYWMWGSDPVSQKFKKQFEEKFPLEKLNEMIDH